MALLSKHSLPINLENLHSSYSDLVKRHVFRPDLSEGLTGDEVVTTIHPGNYFTYRKSIAFKYSNVVPAIKIALLTDFACKICRLIELRSINVRQLSSTCVSTLVKINWKMYTRVPKLRTPSVDLTMNVCVETSNIRTRKRGKHIVIYIFPSF